MWLFRIVVRLLIKAVVLLGAMWYVIDNVDGADQFVPLGFQRLVKWALVSIIVGGLVLVLGGAVRAIRSHLQSSPDRARSGVL
jgi:hypothetical protein